MVKLTLEQIKKLPPEQRIKFLKIIEEKRKKEIEEAEKLVEKSETEIKEKKVRTEEEETREKEKREIRAIATGREEALEKIVEETEAKEEEPKAPIYGAPLEALKKIYKLATKDVYSSLKIG